MEDTVTTNVIKRNGEEVHFDRAKIVNAITKANGNVERIHQMNPYQIEAIADTIAEQVQETPHAVNVEDIQDMVETSIMEMRGYEVAQKYVRYRYRRELKRKSNTTDNGILALHSHLSAAIFLNGSAFFQLYFVTDHTHIDRNSFLYLEKFPEPGISP